MTTGKIYLGGEKDAPFVIDTREKVLPFGRAFRLEGKYEVRFRLRSTAGGGASWEYTLPENHDPEVFFSWGRYNPSVRFIAENPTVLWERHGEKLRTPSAQYFVEQKYLLGYNPFTSRIGIYFDSAEPLPADKALHQCIENLWVTYFEQGHLRVYPANPEISWSTPYWGVKTFLNHQILGGELLAKERKDGTLYALVRFLGKGWIVSPDHLENPIRLYRDEEAYFVLAHPEPVSDTVD